MTEERPRPLTLVEPKLGHQPHEIARAAEARHSRGMRTLEVGILVAATLAWLIVAALVVWRTTR